MWGPYPSPGRDITTSLAGLLAGYVAAVPSSSASRDDVSDTDPKTRARLRDAARTVFGWEELHPRQLEAMEHVMRGRDEWHERLEEAVNVAIAGATARG